jgi:amino acid transporter
MVLPDYSVWEEGTLETIAMSIAPWLGVWVGAAAVIATLGEFNVVMACSSRALWAVADYKMLPSVLTGEWQRFGTPIAAVIFQTVTTGILMNFSFEFLVVLDTFFNKYVCRVKRCRIDRSIDRWRGSLTLNCCSLH